jgi:hypothetical protein
MTALQFDPVTFMYYFPEIVVNSNVTTVEAAKNYNDNHPEKFQELVVVDSNGNFPTSDFNGQYFVLKYCQYLDVSRTNDMIRQAMIKSGATSNDVIRAGKYIEFININIEVTSNNFFLVSSYNNFEENYHNNIITQSNLRIGDKILVTKNNQYSLYFDVTGLYDNTILQELSFSVSNPYYNINDSNSSYILKGYLIYDIERLGRINYARQAGSIYNLNNNIISKWDQNFNYQLYQVLYPESRLLTKEECYYDYLKNYAQQDFKIGYASDILNQGTPIFDLYHDVFKLNSATNIDIKLYNFSSSNEVLLSLVDKPSHGMLNTIEGDVILCCSESNRILFGVEGFSNTMCIQDRSIVTTTDTLSVNSSNDIDFKFINSNNSTDALISLVTVPGHGMSDTIQGDIIMCCSNNRRILFGVEGNSNTMWIQDKYVGISGAFESDEVYTVSDARKKSNIIVIDDALGKLLKLQGYTYTKNDSPERRQMGLLAQEVMEVAPELVSTDNKGMLSVAYGNMTGIFVEAINALHQRVIVLEERLSAFTEI